MPKIKMIPIHSGASGEWGGWYNLVLDVDGNAGNSKPLALLDPETAKQVLQALNIK